MGITFGIPFPPIPMILFPFPFPIIRTLILQSHSHLFTRKSPEICLRHLSGDPVYSHFRTMTMMMMIIIINHANESRRSKVFNGVCVCTIKPKRLKLKSPNSTQSITSPRPPTNIRSKGERLRSQWHRGQNASIPVVIIIIHTVTDAQ